MHIRQVNPNTHPACRSLLQKAVRRGNSTLVTKVFNHLYEIGDIRWLKQRIGVMVAEECWPLMVEWTLPEKKQEEQVAMVETLSKLANSVKFKDAAGLGSLAYALSEGDRSVLTGCEEDDTIRWICGAITDNKKYWEWAISQCSNTHETRLVKHAEKAYGKGGWPWDRAFIQATAYLAIMDGLPELYTVPTIEVNFPFWVALDKHTPQGKAALHRVAKETRFSWRQLNWVSFYCESGRVTKKHEPSRWWDKEVEWRLGKVGLSFDSAEAIWAKAQPIFIELLKEESTRLEQHIGDSVPTKLPESKQLSLF
ncbi:MAG: hypothetical protein OXI72_10565 [Gemmatimonadota bacterium]|nr:hypothetical protein [Gemmatimonadota bacterium]